MYLEWTCVLLINQQMLKAFPFIVQHTLRAHAMHVPVTAALLQLPAAARPGHRIRDARRRESVDKRRLPRAYQR